MTDTVYSDDELQLTDVLIHLPNVGRRSDTITPLPADLAASKQPAEVVRMNVIPMAVASAQVLPAEQRLQELQEQLLQQTLEITELRRKLVASTAAVTRTEAANPFDMVLTLSKEREAALRERKLYKDRASIAESNMAQLESDLAAANANAKLQSERANKLLVRQEELQRRATALEDNQLADEQRIAELEALLSARPDTGCDDNATNLQRLLQERDRRIRELERQLTDRAGTPTLFGGEVERFTSGVAPDVIYALTSLDAPDQSYKLTRAVNTIGRSTSNDIALDSISISRFHARLINKADGMWLVDLQSINGCHVNEQRVSSQILNEGDVVLIGDCRFKFSALTRARSGMLQAS